MNLPAMLYILILMRLKCFVNGKIKDFQVKKNGFTQHIKKVLIAKKTSNNFLIYYGSLKEKLMNIQLENTPEGVKLL